ncbi:MAG TPA: hypothetical protein VIN36_00190 [Thiobacillus sp.]
MSRYARQLAAAQSAYDHASPPEDDHDFDDVVIHPAAQAIWDAHRAHLALVAKPIAPTDEQLAPFAEPEPALVDRIREGVDEHKRRNRESTPIAWDRKHPGSEL